MSLALNPAQEAAVHHAGGPLLVLAGAGSGKTRVLTARIAHLIHDRGVPPERVFAVTFTNKAAGEMRSRIAGLLGADPRGLWIGTFHALAARLLRREAARLGFGSNFTIYDSDDSESFIKRLLDQRGLSPKANPPRAIHAIISGAKNRMVPPEEFAAIADGPLARAAAEVYALLGPALQQANAMDFDDLLLHPLTLFARFPDRLAYWQRRFEHVLVDEFQDTNAAQYRMVRLLAAEHKNLCVVGDDDQAIYGWRGADVRHMLTFQQDFPGTTLVKLEQNYRSTQVILDAANGVIAENAERLGKTLFTARQGGDPVILLTAADERDEAQWLAAELARVAAETDIPYEGMAVLYRTNAQSRPLEEAFRHRGVPYRLVGAVSFYERREVKDLLAYLRLIVNPAEEGAEGIDRLENVQELVAGAAEWAEDAGAANGGGGGDEEPATLLERYLTQAVLVTPADGAVEDAAAGVTLMTVHMAKGLEWPAVALAGLEDGLFPLGRSAGVPGGLEEERRLCYVGLTRARERLYLSWARTRYRSGRLELSEPSRFLEALPAGALEERSTTPLWDRGTRGMRGAARGGRVQRPAPAELDWEVEASQDAPRYATGERVRHRKFGGGVVRAVSGSGRELKVTVEFDDQEIGTKQLLVAYAGLEREWESA